MVFQVDLKRNPQVADLISSMEMGDKVKFLTSLKSKTGELAEFTLDEAAECSDADMKEHYADDGDGTDAESGDEDQAEANGDQMKNKPTMPSPGGSGNTPGGSKEQDQMAAAVSAQI